MFVKGKGAEKIEPMNTGGTVCSANFSVTLTDALFGVAAHHVPTVQHRFVFELGWRECFRHVWAQHGAGILQSLHPSPLPGEAYARELPNDIRQGTIGALAQSGQPMAEITPTR